MPIAPLGGTRRFDPLRPVPDEELAEVLRRATRAPSPFNLQPWRFIVVRHERNRRKLQECAYRHPLLAEAPVAVIVLGYHHPHRSHLDAMLGCARGAICESAAAELRARAARALERSADLALWAAGSSMLAAGMLIAAADSLGLASVLIDEFEPEKIRQAFGVPDDHTVCAVIVLGFAAGEPPFLGRFGLAEVCYAEHFGQRGTLGEAG